MKKITVVLLLTLALCVVAFASCGKSGEGDAAQTNPATASETTGGTTAHVHTPAAEYTVDKPASCVNMGSKSYHCTECGEIIPETVVVLEILPHTPDPEMTILENPTCKATGLKAYYCEVCGEIIESTLEVIPVDLDAHKVETWSDTPTVLNPSVHVTGECTVCHTILEEEHEFVPDVYNSKTASAAFSVSKSTEEIRGDKHFHPTEEDPDGNDLWFEYTFLWNPTFANWTGLAEMEVAGLWNSDGQYAHHRPFFYCYLRDGVKDYCKYAGHFDYTTNMPELGAGVFLDTENGQTYLAGYDEVVTANSHPSLGEYGWHRLGVRYHQEVVGYDEEKGGTVYSGYHELFIDGVKVWKILSNVQGHWNGSSWYTKDKDLKSKQSMLWTAEYDGEKWTYSENSVSVRLYLDESIRSAANPVYVVIDDPIWTCGDGFALNVEPVENPVETTFVLVDGVQIPGTVFFKMAD